MPILYRGFTTIDRNKKFRATDIDLVKRDLLNHFSVRKGERLMNPSFGTVIWGLLFEPLDAQTEQIIIDDVTAIVNYDPRVSLTKITLTEQDSGLLLQLDLIYNPTNQAAKMSLQFDADSQILTTTGVY
jgi:phage baseplate assembly protein W